MTIESYLKSVIRTVPDWPSEGVQFRDVTPVFTNPEAFRRVIDAFEQRYKDSGITSIGAMDARGFLLGSTLAYKLELPLVLFRKKGKLPGKTLSQKYALEYGEAELEVHEGDINSDDKVLLIDDLIATGGTLLAAHSLVSRVGAEVIEAAAIIDLPDLKGSEKLTAAGIKCHALCEYAGL
ncbi:adenine phosphoribosyltransferase [Endozoicomonadaceae bacterium StTr2]